MINSKRIESYKKNRHKYVKLSKKFESLVKKIAKKHNLKIQVQKRAKDVTSLEQKLQNPDFQKKRLNQIYDLCGVRCILYTEDELAIFSRALKTSIGYESIIKDKTEYSLEDYNALHSVFRVKEDKICGISFKGLKGLNCEVQMTSSLLHPWNELSHVMLYKNSDIDEFVPTEFEKNKKDMVEVINKHLWEATHKLNSAYGVHLKLVMAKQHFESKKFAEEARSNRWHIALNHCFKTKEYLENFDIFRYNEFNYFDWAYGLRTRWKKKDFRKGKYNFPHIHSTTQNIVTMLRFYSEVETFYFLIDDYFSSNEKVKQDAESALTNWFSFDSSIFKIEGPQYFTFPIREFKEWNAWEREAANNLITSISKNLLVTNFHRTEMSKHDALSINHSRVNPTKNIRKLRSEVFALLFEQYHLLDDFSKRKLVIESLFEGCSAYFPHNPPASLISMVSSDMNQVIRFFIKNFSSIGIQLLRVVETQLYMPKNKYLRVSRSTKTLLKKLNSNAEYIYFRNMTYIPEDYRGLDYEERMEKAQIAKVELALTIQVDDWGLWKNRIEKLLLDLETSKDFRRQNSFGEFIDVLCKFNPSFAEFLFAKSRKLKEQYFYVFNINLFENLSLAEKRNKIVSGFRLKNTRNQALKASVTLGVFNKLIADSFLSKCKSSEDINFFLQEVGFANLSSSLLKNLFFKAIIKLNSYESCTWTIWWKHRFQKILPNITNSDKMRLVENLAYAKEDNYWVEEVLIDICGVDEKMILKYFSTIVESKNDHNLPYEMNRLSSHISKNEIDLVPWLVPKIDYSCSRHNSYLTVLNIVEPTFSLRLESYLRVMLKTDLTKNIESVLRIMRKYSGTPAVDNLVLDIVDLTNNSEEYNSDLIMIVEFYRQVYSGQFGRVRILESTLTRVEEWREDTRDVRSFKKRMVAFLKKRIADETKMATAEEKSRILSFERSKETT
ncbi:MAG: RelA/SpoT domain-containing protein [Bdellovibrionaceae bacterium]|jgi:ppGpp synthetase/RelA/SpoT-type nucleotidyltranferase|nr:RelA/SpoT domain-containing protein [Pseudobdellovibrionaceae bacterium]